MPSIPYTWSQPAKSLEPPQCTHKLNTAVCRCSPMPSPLLAPCPSASHHSALYGSSPRSPPRGSIRRRPRLSPCLAFPIFTAIASALADSPPASTGPPFRALEANTVLTRVAEIERAGGSVAVSSRAKLLLLGCRNNLSESSPPPPSSPFSVSCFRFEHLPKMRLFLRARLARRAETVPARSPK